MIASLIRRPLRAGIMALLGVSVAVASAHADQVADFYRGKTLNLIIGTSSGNDYDFRGRLLARYLGRHLPGEPTIIPQNMPGVGGVKAANYLATIAPHDGTTLHMIMSNMMSSEAIGAQGVQFDTRKFFWIGNTSSTPNVTVSWYKSGVTSIEQVKTRPLIVGAPGGTAGVIYVTAMNGLIGTKFKLVTGYPGGNEVNLALERGEIDGRASNSWASWKSTHPDWVKDKKIIVLVQIGLKRAPDLADVPLLYELAHNDMDRQVLTFLSTDTAIARSLVATPDTPPERVEALRRAFDATMRDPDFLAEAEKAQLDVDPMPGAEAQKIADSIVNTPPDVVARAKALLGDLLK
ncbi:MAG TPA: tripartite tricarboxylate transporter substrate-binding protein [Xanthobacteraceae bacterium]|jgi:tripartite-type tricarboxylate transporter receptor subunit TctC|nr:tripartite tricarboxylate transporter substrate-binding protein [Xanthobacteraceae bacterium]